ncbi:hypothetical protein [Spongiimicrobium sp. 3-5]|uniref:hypothetical protein n=1 Tax=Spongiimicrobium sp. 3-5 TaxID=3332596 RepID=UPI00397F948F
MRGVKILISISVFFVLLSCKNSANSEIIRKDLLKNIEGFIAYSEESISNFKTNRRDTDIYWVEFFKKDEKNVVVVMQQPFVYKDETDGFIKINENRVFFYSSNPAFVDISKLEKSISEQIPGENSEESELGFSAPNWAYYINVNSLEKFELGE